MNDKVNNDTVAQVEAVNNIKDPELASEDAEGKKPAATDPAAAKAAEIAINIEKLELELHEAKSKAEENWNLLLRAKAEVENVRRRSALELEKAHKYSIENFAKELIQIVDSLDKGLEIVDNGEASQIEAILQGMQLTHKLLLDTLDKFAIKEINPIGQEFDPAKHEALSMQESDEVAPNNVLMVVQKGFSIYERILRPARVIVAKSKATTMPKIDKEA